MLKPGGQLVFNGFENMFTDEVYDRLDRGKWSKYYNRHSVTPFYFCKSPEKEYEHLIESVGFVDCFITTEHVIPTLSQSLFEGKLLSDYV